MRSEANRDDRKVVLFLVFSGLLLFALLSLTLLSFAGWYFYRDVFVTTEQKPQSPTHPFVAQQAIPQIEENIVAVAAEVEPTVAEELEHESSPIADDDRASDLGNHFSKSKAMQLHLIADLASLGPEVPTALDHVESALKYSFDPTKKLVYGFEIEAEVGTKKLKYRGRNSLQGTGNRPTITATDDEVDEGSGTGFVIHPQGIIVTCAHVVQGATSIQATIGDSELSATVIKLDFENDLAVLRLNKDDLPYLKLANSDQVRLAQEVRALGYPLSDVLGESIKVTKGEVSGRGGPDGADGLQIDATINPGNSGGPLVDDAGRLVGVTSSLLAGEGISEVGFAIPSNKVIEIAKELNIPVVLEDQATAMSAPDIIDLVSPATALLKLSFGPNGAGMESPYELDYGCYWYESTLPTPGVFQSPSLRHENYDGKIQIDPSGQVLHHDEHAMLPLMIENAGQVGIEMLPNSAPGRTATSRLIVFQQRTAQTRSSGLDRYGFGGFASRRRPPWMRSQSPPPENSPMLLGTESTTIAFGKPGPDGIDVTKTYLLRIDGEAKDEPPLVISGSGKGMFDPNAGRMLHMNYEATITLNQDNLTIRIPIKFNYKLVDQAELKQEQQARLEREESRAKERANAFMNSDSLSPSTTRSVATDDLEFENVKDAPQSTSLNKFDPNK
ncbi:putative serine protease HtrA [Planctomycetes bacterium CA13]|uniref:Putative serine protease HtrA n=1 Tax=Novipirellula herctigrandis TaxID=2527986 RepID=A0A5C5ZBM2_9BACT|nr:putative serine protease HtrA [Planctomycetes bacterium CA13]